MKYSLLNSAVFAAAASLCVTLPMAPAAEARSLEPQTMRDWTVRCTDERYCIAQTPGESKSGEKMLLKLERSNKVDARIYVTTAPKGKKLSLNSHISISVVGHDYRFYGDVQRVYDGNEAAFPEKSTNRSIQKLKAGRFAQVTVKFGDGQGTVKYDLSLQGVTSVLAMMDIIQGRLDREDAAVVIGGEAKTLTSHYDLSAGKAPPKPAASVNKDKAPAKDPEEDIVYPDDSENDNNESDSPEESGLGQAELIYDESKLPDYVLMQGYRVLECDLPNAIEAFGAQEINLEPGLFLYLVPCKTGDVNISYYVALQDAGEVELMEFQVPASATGQPEALLTNAAWDKNLNGLTSETFFSPNRDCGKHEKHIFWPEDGRFNLSEYRLKESCDGVASPTSSYPIEWNGEGD
jgi:invasion protein IalB